MKWTKTFSLSGKKHTLKIEVYPGGCEKEGRATPLPLNDFAYLSEGERRFLIDGIPPEEWGEMSEEEANYRYDRQATRAFWICYSATLLVAIVFCYVAFWE